MTDTARPVRASVRGTPDRVKTALAAAVGTGGNPVMVVAVFVIGIGLIHASLTGTQGSLLTEQFGTSTRTSGASIGYQVAASLGGFAPLLAAVAVGAFDWPGAALLYVGAAVIGLIGILLTRETWGPRERAEVAALLRDEEARTPERSSRAERS